METIKEWADRYRNNMKWVVVPCEKGKKYPSINWKQYQTRFPTQEEHDEWFSKDVNIALITGALSNVVVIDEDSYKKSGKVLNLDTPFKVKTGSGGTHYYFRYKSGVKNTVNAKDAVDVRGQGGLVILPPSIHPNGTPYEWLTKSGNHTMPTLEDSFATSLISKKPNERIDLTDYVNLEEGSRDDSLLRVACSLLNKVSEKEAIVLINAVNNTFTPPLPDQDVRRIYSSALNFVKNNPKHSQEVIKTEPIYYSQLSKNEIYSIDKRPVLPVGLKKIDELFPFPSGYYVICANPGVGKGWFALWLARNWFTKHKRKSVFFSLEMPESLVRQRLLQAWSDRTEQEVLSGLDTTKALDLLQQDAITVYSFGQEDGAYQTPENFEKDFNTFYDQGYRIFMFDHLHELDGATVPDKNHYVTEKWGKAFQNICKAHPDIWLIIFGQPNGAAADKKVLRKHDFYGSKAITQKCEYFISLNRPVEKDSDTGEIIINSQDRSVIFWLDKSRTTSRQQEGAKIYFSKTGNFHDVDSHRDKLTVMGFPDREESSNI